MAISDINHGYWSSSLSGKFSGEVALFRYEMLGVTNVGSKYWKRQVILFKIELGTLRWMFHLATANSIWEMDLEIWTITNFVKN